MINISQKYDEFLQSFSLDEKFTVDFNDTKISEDIFFHLLKIKLAGWKYRVNFQRVKKHSISDIFQDLLAAYLKTCLPINYAVELEKSIKNKKPHVDILISKDNNPHFVIEVKTTIGWSRHDLEGTFSIRRENIATTFNIEKSKIIYIFLEHSNVSKEFSSKYWDAKTNTSIKLNNRPRQDPYSFIFPLFNKIDPYYWDYDPSFEKDKIYKNLSDNEIRGIARKNIVTPFEHILKLILE
jgi:hypothetical protein